MINLEGETVISTSDGRVLLRLTSQQFLLALAGLMFAIGVAVGVAI